jgi:hypothetical protein
MGTHEETRRVGEVDCAQAIRQRGTFVDSLVECLLFLFFLLFCKSRRFENIFLEGTITHMMIFCF